MNAPSPTDFPVRFSNLNHMGKSPAHYLSALTSRRDTPEMLKGRALHSYLLGDENAVALYPGKVRRGKEFDAFAAANPNREILIASEIREVDGMRESIARSHDACRLLFELTKRETEVRWKIGSRECSGRPDAFAYDRIVELKSTRSAHPDRFVRQARWMHYHAQLAWYRQGVRLSGLGKPQSAYVVAVESSRPYPVTVFELTEQTLEQGERLCRAWFERLRVCEDSNSWPAYTDWIVPFDLEEDGTFTLTMGGEELEVA